MLRARVAPPVVEELAFASDGLTAERGYELGLVRRVAPLEQMVSVVDQELGSLAAKAHAAYVATKRFLYREVWDEMRRRSREDEDAFLDCWFAPATQSTLRTMARSLGG